jgi:SAM-dependent methyltransferase
MSHSVLEADYTTITHCRICGSTEVEQILDLGAQPLANSLLINPDAIELFVPLIIIRCENCSTIQLSVNVDPKLMFQEYLWVTGTSEISRKHCQDLANIIIKISPNAASILEIGSNDGTLLKELESKGVKRLTGVDPAKNIAAAIQETKFKICSEFFSSKFAKEFSLENEKVDVVVARNVLSHVPDLNDVMVGISEILSEDGLVVIEFHEATKILTELHYDSIYHEHIFYHSIKSMAAALEKIGFKIFDLMKSPISGGSFVIFASRKDLPKSKILLDAIQLETVTGIYDLEVWRNFAEEVSGHLKLLRTRLNNSHNETWRGYGASARSSTLLNAIGPVSKNLVAVADNNPLKSHRYSPGIHLLIDKPEQVIDKNITHIFVFAFNFEEEIVKHLRDTLHWSGKIYVPLPNLPREYSI